MKKYIEIPFEVVERLVEGKCVEGSLRRDQFTGKITFRAYLRQPRVHHKDKLVKKLPWGWVKESMERIKVFGSFPKDMGTAHVIGLLDEHNHDAKDALIDREIINIV
ncbi:MAG: hypothetical protein IKM77_13370 [Prevotella sp.]|jgi:hypothetical protein|nr:hypothetical protein [Prevotella sp.]